MMLSGGHRFSEVEALERYRAYVWIDGQEAFERGPDDAPVRVRKGFTRADVESVLRDRGKLSQSEALRCRVRYFTDGCALGGREFVNAVFEENRPAFGAKRCSGARKLRQVEMPGIYVLRDLRTNLIS